MLKIEPHVFDAFAADARARFVTEAIAHGSAYDPNGFGRLATEVKRAAIDDLLVTAKHYGIVGKAGTILLLESRCLLGSRFPFEPEHEWARNLLETPRVDETRTLVYVRDTALEKVGRHA